MFSYFCFQNRKNESNDCHYEFILYSGNDTKISIQKIPLSCSADIDYMLTQIAMQMAKRGYEPLSGVGFRKWPAIYE